MDDSILTTIKKMLGPGSEHNHFDTEIIIHINSAFNTLNQLGLGPSEGFAIQDKTSEWTEFIPEDNKHFESVKSYVYLKVKLIFDPPTNSAVIDSMKEMIKEFEWRLNAEAESN